MPDAEEVDRRPIKARGAWWASPLASACARAGLTPNQVSLLSVVFACGGGGLFILAANVAPPIRLACFIGAAVCIQLRLLCNMIDGMIAVEGGMQSRLGVMFNEIPDRLADSLFLVCAGYASFWGQTGIELGWAAALLAVFTAYIRAFGAGQGLKQDFCGPMAKPHRMFTLTISCLLGAGEIGLGYPPRAIGAGLWVIVVGGLATCIRRIWRQAQELNRR